MMRSITPLRIHGLLLFTLLLFPLVAQATTTTVHVGTGGGLTYTPNSVTIAPGDTVQWIWDAAGHSVTSGTPGAPDGLFDTGLQGPPFTFSFTFNSAGSFPYYCSRHLAMMTGTVNVVAASPTPSPSPIAIAGTITYCWTVGSTPTPGIQNVTLTVTGSASGSTLSDASGNYQLSSLPSGGNYTVTPSKSPFPVGTTGSITTLDAIAVQRHFLGIGPPLTGCKLTAADVNGDSMIGTPDIIAITRYYLHYLSGYANVGKHQFNPASRTYSGVTSDQTNQNYSVLVFGDVAGNPVYRPSEPGNEEAIEADAADPDGSE